MDDPIAYFLTWGTYGTWLPGDPRGWIEYQRGWQLPNPIRELEARYEMAEDACRLSVCERQIVAAQVAETCAHRGWVLYAVNCRSNHLHLVVGAHEASPLKVRNDIKAWCTRRLREQSNPLRLQWWAERGSQRWIFSEEQLDQVVSYVTEAQDRKHLDEPPAATRPR
jgi:REP element-mobilizing transposase RayT